MGRAWHMPSIVVLVVSTVAMLPFLLAVAFLPGLFLGRDGRWMVQQLAKWWRAAHNGGTENHDKKAATTREPSSPTLHPLYQFVRGLAGAGVRYCRWKSRLDLDRVLTGAGDLDLLVDPQHAAIFLRLARSLGFKQLIGCFEPALPTGVGTERHLYGLDSETGALLHLHVSFSLADEGSFLQEIGPALTELVLQHCSPAQDMPVLEGMPVVEPEAEIIVHVLCAWGSMPA